MAVTMRATRALAKILVAVDRVLKFEVYHFLVSNDQFFCNLSSGSASRDPKNFTDQSPNYCGQFARKRISGKNRRVRALDEHRLMCEKMIGLYAPSARF
jgi:hypothetical protein